MNKKITYKEPSNKLTLEQINERLKERSNLTIVKEIDRHTLLCHCSKCGFDIERRRDQITHSYGCPICKGFVVVKGYNDFATTHPEVVKYLVDKEDGYKYPHSTKTKVEVQCPDCGYRTQKAVGDLCRRGFRCPCQNNMTKLYVGYNDIQTKAPWMMEYLVDKKDAVKHTTHTHTKLLCACPICGKTKYLSAANLYNQGFTCDYCQGGLSFANRFIRALVKQLPVKKVKFEYSPKWAGDKFYDCYFQYQGKQYIVEMDGKQHHVDTAWSTRDKQKDNDDYKDRLAQSHNITMIRINCFKGEFEYIKTNILNSILVNLFDLIKVDWVQCEQDCISPLVKDVCMYWDSHDLISNKEIGKIFGISKDTVTHYLRIGHEVGFIQYSKEIAETRRLRVVKSAIPSKRGIKGEIYDANDKLIFSFTSLAEAAKKLNSYLGISTIYGSTIQQAIRSHKKVYGCQIITA